MTSTRTGTTMSLYKVGKVARRTGITVRTLHHYDEIGLLSPQTRTASGHRLYGPENLERLQQIVTLRQLGFGLDEIRRMLERDELTTLELIETQIERLEERIERHRALIRQLHALAHRLSAGQSLDPEETLNHIEALVMFEKYYTPEQLKYLEERAEQVGEQRMQEVQGEWQELFARARELQARGVDPKSPEARELVAWQHRLIEEFTGGDDDIRQSLGRMYQQEPGAGKQFGIDSEAMGFLGEAAAAQRKGS